MKRLLLIGLVASLLPVGSAAGQATPPPLPTLPPTPIPPSELPGAKGSIQIGELYDASKGTPPYGYTSSAEIKPRENGDWVEDRKLPFGLPTLVGSYKVTAYWQTAYGPSGPYREPSNECAVYLNLRKDEVKKLTVIRSALGCRIVANPPKSKNCKKKRDKKGKLRCKRPRLEVAPLDPPVNNPPPLGKPFPTIGITATADDFGSVPVGTTSAPITYTLKSYSATGLGPLTIDFGPDVNPDFAVSSDTCTGQTLAPSATCTFDISFTPSAPGFSQDGFVPTYPGGNGGVGVGVRGTGV